MATRSCSNLRGKVPRPSAEYVANLFRDTSAQEEAPASPMDFIVKAVGAGAKAVSFYATKEGLVLNSKPGNDN